ncbi:hypothetical protein GCM10010172_35370 [Paractinoplanes ferrugineus]|uniref:Uncharacterized protein n=1 Tax=Paractinoplanes ferrugineus TaxID=113564 RepID=A0A919JBU4_9ACTN|nr:hypothetical protein [Actinoplanes ferrugineus]GIE16753.1 hypothetical protein Afe05nite_85930 [Actinoplanes ferrugineus]
MARFRSIPVEVDAEQWSGSNEADLAAFTSGDFNALDAEDRENCDDPDATGQLFERSGRWRLVFPGDWIVRENAGFYVCRPDAFTAQFEAVQE